MSDVLGRLVDRALGSPGGLRPRTPARFEPSEAVGPSEALTLHAAEADGPARHSPVDRPAAGPTGVVIAAPTPSDDPRPPAPVEPTETRVARVRPTADPRPDTGEPPAAARPRSLGAAPRRPEPDGRREPPGPDGQAAPADAPRDGLAAAARRTDDDSPRAPRIAAIERVAAAAIDRPTTIHDHVDPPLPPAPSGPAQRADGPGEPATRVRDARAPRVESRSAESDVVADAPAVVVRARSVDTAPRSDGPDLAPEGRLRERPIVRVSIGRIEVRAVHPPAPIERKPAAPPTTAPSLEAYLRARNGTPR